MQGNVSPATYAMLTAPPRQTEDDDEEEISELHGTFLHMTESEYFSKLNSTGGRESILGELSDLASPTSDGEGAVAEQKGKEEGGKTAEGGEREEKVEDEKKEAAEVSRQ